MYNVQIILKCQNLEEKKKKKNHQFSRNIQKNKFSKRFKVPIKELNQRWKITKDKMSSMMKRNKIWNVANNEISIKMIYHITQTVYVTKDEMSHRMKYHKIWMVTKQILYKNITKCSNNLLYIWWYITIDVMSQPIMSQNMKCNNI